MPSNNSTFFGRPTNEKELSELAEIIINKADAVGVLPTPIDDLVLAASVTEISKLDRLNESFLSGLKKNVRDTFKEVMQKVRGIADLRERVIYIPGSENPSRAVFAKAHELGHQVIPWHNVDPAYLDDDITLSPDIELEFEQEASFFASEILFQGKTFGKQVKDFAVSFDAVFKLADIYGVSRQATLWRYVEEQDEAIALAQYYPINVYDEHGKQVLNLWKTIPSPKFVQKYGKIEIPSRIRTGHPWTAARDLKICDGKEIFRSGENSYTFEWQAWWNNYAMFVLLRRKPTLGIIGNLIRHE